MPKDIEAPIPILFFDPLEFILSVAMMGFGVVVNAWIPGLVCAVAILMGSRYLKKGARKGAAQHLMWSLGLQLDPSFKRIPPSWVNDFTE